MNKNKYTFNNTLQITSCLLVICVIILTACTSAPPKIEPVELYPEPVAGSESTCSDDLLNHCALSLYELRDGKTPVLSDHPSVFSNYKNAGQR